MFDSENGCNLFFDNNTHVLSDLTDYSSLNYLNSQEQLSLESEFDSKYVAEREKLTHS